MEIGTFQVRSPEIRLIEIGESQHRRRETRSHKARRGQIGLHKPRSCQIRLVPLGFLKNRQLERCPSQMSVSKVGALQTSFAEIRIRAFTTPEPSPFEIGPHKRRPPEICLIEQRSAQISLIENRAPERCP